MARLVNGVWVSSERGMIFDAESIHGFQAGTKSQTRRVVVLERWMVEAGMSLDGTWVDPGLGFGQYLKVPGPDETVHRLHCPYGDIGDRLYAKETWYCPRQLGGSYHREKLIFKADADAPMLDYSGVRWRSPRFMPKWAARFRFELTDVRVQRLQDIAPDDAIADGVAKWGVEQPRERDVFDGRARGVPYLVNAFAERWDDINRARGYPWAQNDYVWALTLRPLS